MIATWRLPSLPSFSGRPNEKYPPEQIDCSSLSSRMLLVLVDVRCAQSQAVRLNICQLS
jgi:hypothetical protein